MKLFENIIDLNSIDHADSEEELEFVEAFKISQEIVKLMTPGTMYYDFMRHNHKSGKLKFSRDLAESGLSLRRNLPHKDQLLIKKINETPKLREFLEEFERDEELRKKIEFTIQRHKMCSMEDVLDN